MRRARVTYQGAYHHVMNRGYDGKPIFEDINDKELFLTFLKKYSEKLKIRIFSYCIMNNHYHLILENSSARMSDFLRQLNGNFGSSYRAEHGGKGYVFQGRAISTLIQDDSYLLLSIAYGLNNPVRAGLVKNFLKYEWSSASCYFNKDKSPDIVDISYVEDLFGDQRNLIDMVNKSNLKLLPIIGTRIGKVIGNKDFVSIAKDKFDRRDDKESMEGKRINDLHFEPVEKIFMEFEKKHKIKVEEIDISNYYGKRLRGELLFNLKEKAGLKYAEIIKMDLFSDLKLHSLGKLYKSAKQRLERS
ncbi:MAG: transposase [Acidobacteriota bacterium]